jgi:hypothetical protein
MSVNLQKGDSVTATTQKETPLIVLVMAAAMVIDWRKNSETPAQMIPVAFDADHDEREFFAWLGERVGPQHTCRYCGERNLSKFSGVLTTDLSIGFVCRPCGAQLNIFGAIEGVSIPGEPMDLKMNPP